MATPPVLLCCRIPAPDIPASQFQTITLELLTRRNIKMWFVTDRDERDDGDVKQMLQRLGGLAVLKVLDRRELEN
jgi:hypothetical protein